MLRLGYLYEEDTQVLKASHTRLTCFLELLFTTSNCEIVVSSQTDNKIDLHRRTDNQNLGEQKM